MKKFIITTITALAATTANATDFKVKGTVIDSYAITGYQNRQKVETNCEYQDIIVPNSNAGAGALTGAIIGGVLGKGITGKDDGAAAGALFGAIVGADKSQKKGNRVESVEVCEDNIVTYREETVKYYVVKYEWNGYRGEFQTQHSNYYRGQKINLTLTLKRF